MLLGDDRFHRFDGILVRRPASVTGANVVIIGVDAGDLAVVVNPRRPIPNVRAVFAVGDWRVVAAEVGINLRAVARRIQRGDDGLAIGPSPDAYVKRNTFGRL